MIPVVGWNWCGWGYIAANRDLLNSLPVPPGVERVRVGSDPYRKGDMAVTLPDGWGTLATFLAPEGTTREDVVRFYIRELSPDWEYCIDTIKMLGGGNRVGVDIVTTADRSKNIMGSAVFGNGTASVSVNTLNMSISVPESINSLMTGDTYHIYVDHDSRREPTCQMEYPLPLLP